MDLTEQLLEIDAHAEFADEFFHASEASARVDDLPVSVSTVLKAEACNIGLEPLIRSNVSALTRHRLNWTKSNIALQWGEMIRATGSLKLGKIQASALVRSLLKVNAPPD